MPPSTNGRIQAREGTDGRAEGVGVTRGSPETDLMKDSRFEVVRRWSATKQWPRCGGSSIPARVVVLMVG